MRSGFIQKIIIRIKNSGQAIKESFYLTTFCFVMMLLLDCVGLFLPAALVVPTGWLLQLAKSEPILVAAYYFSVNVFLFGNFILFGFLPISSLKKINDRI